MIHTLKNFLGHSFARTFQQQLLSTNQFKWDWVENTGYEKIKENKEWDFSWAHFVFRDGQIVSDLYPYLMPIVLNIGDAIGVDAQHILRIRIGCNTKTPMPIIHSPHIDSTVPHYTALLYLNDSDGDTVIYNQKYPFLKNSAPHDEYSKNLNFTELARHSPEFNKVVVFDGSHYHSSSSPTIADRRIVVTMNFLNQSISTKDYK